MYYILLPFGYVGNLEMTTKTKEWFPRIWHRYVDNIIAVVKVGEEEKILEQLNKQHESIKFTMEMEQQDSISFLDMRLLRKGSYVEVDIYRKPTDAPLCIPWDSCHHPSHKFAAFESAIHRMLIFPLNDINRKKEMNYVLNMERINGYEERTIWKIYSKHKRKYDLKKETTLEPERKRKKENQTDKGRKINVVLPFNTSTSYKIENILKHHEINVCYENRGTMREIIGKVKEKRPPMQESGIYKISCQDCDSIYVGQTKRRLSTRNDEHRRACTNKETQKSAVAEHMVKNRHKKGECQLIKTVNKPWRLDAWESLYMDKGGAERLMNTQEAPIKSRLFKFASVREF